MPEASATFTISVDLKGDDPDELGDTIDEIRVALEDEPTLSTDVEIVTWTVSGEQTG